MPLILTGIDDVATRTRYAQLRSRIEASIPPHTAITVTGIPVRRTLKLLSAVAQGHWVVGSAYLTECARARKAVDPEAFELHQECPGCRKSRISGGGTALAGLEVVIRGQTAIPAAQLVDLLRAAGAIVRHGRDVGMITVTRLHPRRELPRSADEGWLLEQIMLGGKIAGGTTMHPQSESEGISSDEEAPAAATGVPAACADDGGCALDSAPQLTKQLRANTYALRSSSCGVGAQPPPIAPAGATGDLVHATASIISSAAATSIATAAADAATARAAAPPLPLPKRSLRGTSSRTSTGGGDGESAASTAPSSIVASTSEELLASTTSDERSAIATECRLLPPPAPTRAGDFTFAEALAIRLYRQRLPACNVDIQQVGSPQHPGLTPRRRPSDGDFLQLLVHGSGARTAVARRSQGTPSAGGDGALLYGACSFIPHPSSAFCELQLLAIAPRYAGRGLGSRLLAAVEEWLRTHGVTHVVALAGLDTVEFWRKKGYGDVQVEESAAAKAEPVQEDRRGSSGGTVGCKRKRRSDLAPAPATKLTPDQWALVRDPFGSSKAMMKAL